MRLEALLVGLARVRVFLILSFLLCVTAAHAGINAHYVQLSRSEDALYLNMGLDFDLAPTVENALMRGVPLVFVTRVHIVKARWYWTDKVIHETERALRLSYQPLSKKWRVLLSVPQTQVSGSGITLGKSFDTLKDALDEIKNLRRWYVVDWEKIQPLTDQRIEIQFLLDLSKMPQPLHFGAIDKADWSLEYRFESNLAVELMK